MNQLKVRVALVAAVVSLSGCGPSEPNDAAGLNVLRTMFERAHVPVKILSFKKTMGRSAKTPSGDVYEYWYESDVQFPQGFEAKCADEKERGACALLGVVSDQTFGKNEVVRSEGSLHFAKSEKGWVGEDDNTY
ncbi:MAG TPA: hypothetical protein VED87_10665 [Methylocystis sp.]|nr:hypothetical protein [Methylocystis sp.]